MYLQLQKECHEGSIRAESSCTHCDRQTSRQILTSFLLWNIYKRSKHITRVHICNWKADRWTCNWRCHISTPESGFYYLYNVSNIIQFNSITVLKLPITS